MKSPALCVVLKFFQLTFIFTVCGFNIAKLAAIEPEALSDRPNILWLVTEDNAVSTIGSYGDPLARTQNIDRLAAGGIVFEKAYSTAPVCAPSRSGIITGRHAPSNGTHHQRSNRILSAEVKFFPEFLRAQGYFTTNNAKTDYNTSSSPDAAWNENGTKGHWRHRGDGQPFFAVFNFDKSHENYLHKREPLITDPAKVRVPAYLPDTPTVRADLAQYYDCVARVDASMSKVLAQLSEDGLAEDTIIFYYSDHGGATPRSKRFLYDIGTHVGLVAHFPKKFQHLAPSAPGSRVSELVSLVDLAPTMLSLAGITPAAQFQGRAIAGPFRKPAPEFTFMSRDRMDERYDMARAATDGRYRYIRNYYPDQPWGQHIAYSWKQASMKEWSTFFRAGKLNAAQRAFFEPKPAEELFDCSNDPDNVRNLAADPAARRHLLRLRAALRTHLLATRDTGFMPEPLLIEWSGNGPPASIAADADRYPLSRILDLLDALQLRENPESALLRAAIADPNPLVRYWACVGTGKSGLSPESAILLKDSERIVRVAAAEALLKQNELPAALEVIRESMRGPGSYEERLFSVNTAARLRSSLPKEWRPLLLEIGASKPFPGTENNLNLAIASLLDSLDHPR